jgi:hypothetical protein
MTYTGALPDIATSEIKRDDSAIEHLGTPFKVSRIGLGTWAIGGCAWLRNREVGARRFQFSDY